MKKRKIVTAGALTAALAGGVVDKATMKEYVQFSDPNVYETPARIIKSTQMNKFVVNTFSDDVIEPVVMYKAFDKWVCEGTCQKDGGGVIDPDPSLQKPDWGIEKVKAMEAQRIQDGKNITVCVVDTGIDTSHPDVRSVAGRNFTTSNAGDYGDRNGHGTHTAGLVAAINNSVGVVGSSQAHLIIAKVLNDQGSGSNESIANGVVWCVRSGAKIISMSLGGPTPSTALLRSMQYASQQGVKSYVAAGNDGNTRPNYPAAFNVPGLLAISALDQNNQLASFSSFGRHIKMACPGVDINSTVPGGYKRMSGTSMATPICAGIGAIALASKKSIKFLPLGDPTKFGAGIPDALATVQ